MLAISDSFDQEEDELISLTFLVDSVKMLLNEVLMNKLVWIFFAGTDRAAYIPSTTCMKCNSLCSLLI